MKFKRGRVAVHDGYEHRGVYPHAPCVGDLDHWDGRLDIQLDNATVTPRTGGIHHVDNVVDERFSASALSSA
jgi:hypothetical protein